MAGKARVSAMARDLGIASSELMEFLVQIGEYVKSPSSTIDATVVRRLHEHLRRASSEARDATRSVQQRTQHMHQPSAQAFSLPKTNRRQRGPRPSQVAESIGQIFDIDPWTVRVRPQVTKETDPWTRAWFSPEDRGRWESSGVFDPELANRLKEQGITPRTLTLVIHGRTIASRLKQGEPAGHLVALIEEHRRQEERGRAG